MATVSYTVQNIDGNIRVVTWANLTESDSGQPYVGPHFSDSSVQVYGDFGSGGTARLQGTNETATTPSNWAPLADPQGNILDFTSAGLEQVLENPYQTRPTITAGTSVDVTVVVMFMGGMTRWRAQE
jgi:hypothetical protein